MACGPELWHGEEATTNTVEPDMALEEGAGWEGHRKAARSTMRGCRWTPARESAHRSTTAT